MRGFRPELLAAARREAGYSRAELGRLARIKAETVRKWEQGESSPGVDLLARATATLGITIADVVDVPEDEKYPGDWRVLRGLTQPLLGAAAGVSTAQVGAIERGEGTLSSNVASKLAAALDIPESELRDSFERVRNRPPGASA